MFARLLLAAAPALCPTPGPVQELFGPPAPPSAAQEEERIIVVAIEVVGAQRYSRSQLIAALGQRVGEELDHRAIDGGLKRLWTNFRVRGDVSLEEVEGGVTLLLEVEEQPSDREPRFVGNDKVKDKTLRRWGLLEGQQELFVHQAERVRQRLLEGYAREGYYFAEVNIVKRGASEALPDVIFEIREGPKVRVKGVEIRGNDSMPDDRFLYFFKSGLSHLAKRKLNPPSPFSWFGTAFVQEALEADILAMREVYRDRGWLDAVVELARLEFRPDKKGVIIRIAVDEGEPYTVSDLKIEGLRWADFEGRSGELEPMELAFPMDELFELCELEAGVPFEKGTLTRDRFALRDLFGDQGYLSNPSLPRGLSWDFLDPLLTFDVEAKTVAVTYRIVQGSRLRIREILFAGSEHTRDRVLRRELSIFPGQYADLKEINRSLARIQATGYFQDDLNRLDHRDPTYRFLPVPDDPTLVDLQFEVDEGRVVDFNFSGGVDSNDGVFGLISLTMRNFDIADPPSSIWRTWSEIYNKEALHGAGQLLQLELAPGTELSRYRARFLEPDIFRTHLRPISLDLDLVKRVRLYRNYDEDRLTQSVKLGRKFTHDTWGSVGIRNTALDLSNLDDTAPPNLRREARLGDVTFQTLTFDVSTRSLDNIRLPKDGFSAGLSLGVSKDISDGEFDMVETELRSSWYKTAYVKADGTRPSFHFDFNAGVTQPYGTTEEVPYSERYFLGGSRTLRGFNYREVGPFYQEPSQTWPGVRNPGDALGGETYVSGTFEFRYPLHSVVQPGTYQRLESLRGLLFLDYGILDTDAFALDPDELRLSAGFGIGLAWPFPITLNFGFPVREQDGDGKQVFSFSLGG